MGDFRRALSVSPFTETQLGLGSIGGATDVATLQKVLGGSEVFARCNTTRALNNRFDEPSLTRTLERARLAVELGLPFNPVFGLWRTYGDVTHQPAPDFAEFPTVQQPGPWHELTLEQMCGCLERYGAIVAEEVLATGARVEVWDVGNEVDFGVAGVATRPASLFAKDYRAPDNIDPAIGERCYFDTDYRERPLTDDDIDWLAEHVWRFAAQLMGAFAAGVRIVDPNATFSTHLSGLAAARPDVTTAFFSSMRANGFDVDHCATSYYPTSAPGQGLEALKATVDALGEPLFIAEFAYPAEPMGAGPFQWNDAVDGYPLSEIGQASFYRDLCEVDGVSGVRWWAPDFCFSGWSPMAMFDHDGRPRPVLAQAGDS